MWKLVTAYPFEENMNLKGSKKILGPAIRDNFLNENWETLSLKTMISEKDIL